MTRNIGRRLFINVLLVLACLLPLGTVHARPELGPPSIKLRSNVANVVAARLESRGENGELHFTKLEDLHNEAPAEITLTVLPQLARSLQPGRNYVMAYIGWRQDRFPKVLVPRSGGPVLISLPGAAPAIFADSPVLREILSWDLEQSQHSPVELLPLIRAGLQVADWQYQEFFVTEIATRFPLHQHLTDTDREAVVRLATGPATSPYVPEFLFYNGDFLGAAYAPQNRTEVARHVLRETALRLDAGSAYPALVHTAMEYLAENGDEKDGAVLARWLWTNHNGLIETAMESMRRLGVADLAEMIDEVLTQSILDDTNRRVLENYRRRLDAIRQQG